MRSGQVSKTRCTAVSAKRSAPRKPASVVAKIRKGKDRQQCRQRDVARQRPAVGRVEVAERILGNSEDHELPKRGPDAFP
jgi:hypothetical protein